MEIFITPMKAPSIVPLETRFSMMRLRFGRKLRPLQRSAVRYRSVARYQRTTSSSGSARLVCRRR